jgi:dipeptidyl aminopeptidase/acylaminoacyl peptidase
VTEIPYGAWPSPLTADYLVSDRVGLGRPFFSGDDLCWSEGRPQEGGRVALVRAGVDITPPDFNARTRVHEYGGGAITVAPDGTVYASNFADQRIYRLPENIPVTHAEGMRYADGVVDAARGRLICVREDHSGTGEPVNTIVAVDLASGAETVLVRGHDFFASPALSPDGRLAWLAWDHPNMPWDGSTLYLGTFDDLGAVGTVEPVAGGPDESVFQPSWSPDGRLYFVSDRSGFWNIYRQAGAGVECVHERAADFGEPAWIFGLSRYGFVDAGTIAATYADQGMWHLATIDVNSGTLTDVATPYTHFAGISVARGRVLAVAASPTRTAEAVAIDPRDGSVEVLKASSGVAFDERYLSVPEPVEFSTTAGRTAYALYYAPVNPDVTAPEGELPPLLVESHGGPTSATTAALDYGVQYWTTRGFAVLDVNYGGSSMYGRAYRRRLNGRWGVVDVDDCVNGALQMATEGRVDERRLAIRGGSAGGYTTLAALAFRDVFAAGASHFGISDLSVLAADTHKFESRYTDSLIGPWPQAKGVYEERSPIKHVNGLNCPVIFFQGLDDRVVPPNQAEMMVAALRKKGVPVAHVPFAGEGHGFRKADTIKRTAEAELSFYGQILGFTPAGDIEPVTLS